MKNIQEIFNQIQEIKKEQKEIRKEFQDLLKNSLGFQELEEKLRDLKQQKKQIQEKVQGEMGRRYERIEEIKKQLEELKQMLSDVAINNLTDKKAVKVKDEFNNEYIPVYKVFFKKAD